MDVLILGGGGFIGSRVADRLREAGCTVRVATRTGGVDRSDPGTLVRQLPCDLLIDMVAYDEPSTVRLVEATQAVGRYVLISSADVYRNYGGLHGKEHDPPVLEPLTEDSPLRESRYPYRSGPDPAMADYDKIPIEAAVRARRGDWTVLRLPMVYGPGDRQNRFGWIVRPLLGGMEVRTPRAWLDWRTTYGHVDDVAAGVALAATHPAGAGETFNLGEADPPTHRDWIERFRSVIGWSGQVVEDDASPMARRLEGLDLSYPLVLDTGRVRRLLGYREPVPVLAALDSVVAAERGG